MRTRRAAAWSWFIVAGWMLIAGASIGRAADEFPAEWFWGKPDQRAKQNELVGKPTPKLSLTHWRGDEVKAGALKGKVVVVDFWATWCGPCIRSIPHNNEMYEKYKDQGLVIIGACGSGRGQERMNEVADEHKIAYPIARDATEESAEAWRVMWWPTYGVVDRTGKVRALGLKPNHVEAVVKKLLAEPEPADSAKKEKPANAAAAPADEVVKAAWREGDRKRFKGIEGADAPALAVKDWTNGEEVKLDEAKGKVVLLDFWATWCGPCIAAIPHTNELQEKYKEQGLLIVGVCHSRGAEKMKDVVRDKEIKYAVAADVDGKTVATYRVDGYPDYYFIDRAGKLRIADCKNGSVEDAIKALLAEPAPAEATAAAK